ncbi:MAG: LacI family DNA-binding transcriptional regulator [Xanthomonadaceae bacterium]|nr:LacI family DNA-binding transcriptional regulator [Xanthomonadaceae bacterium]MBU6476891.1 LacI family DNA-binding transcriptional regulator [Xanthomonadaceae bacterium]MDE2054439.1 LacI family DNA-binding transcriptional regulator [Xanthomonadaceae bacterium]MDE2225566.1 LacI family DNA-binding transcriptional regulator [Xanthomonadaceae bacterium]MDE2497447.1 LacI family DNA-binding transcriptional regulator [Xanthomonadaceae bacterium]
MMRATIDDVARVAGTSRKTVSRVLNNEPNVRESTRRQVLDTISALKYRPLTSARSLATNRSFMVGLLYDNRSPSYIMEVQAGVLEACEAQHYSMMVQPLVSATPDFVERTEDILSRHRPDGLILTPPITDHPQLLDSLRRNDIPFASIAPIHAKGCIGVVLREREAAAAMVAHLVSLGHRRIAHILGDPRHGAGIWRLAGYRDGLRHAGLKENPAYMVQGQFSFESGVAAARRLLALRQRPSAIFAADDDMAIGAIWAASEAGLAVPGDVSICGFDDTTLATQVWPPLTTVHQPVREMGRRATEELLRRVHGKGEAAMVEVDYEMCIRASTAPAP